MTEYNPKNPDAFNQVKLEEPKPEPINVVSIPGGSFYKDVKHWG